MNELLQLLTLDDLKDKRCHEMASTIGIEAFVNLVGKYGGCEPYIPKADMLIVPVRDVLIKREFDGSNYYDLAQKWGLSERHVRDITQNEAKEIKARPVDGQIKFF